MRNYTTESAEGQQVVPAGFNGRLTGIVVIADASAASVVSVYDGTSASGRLIYRARVGQGETWTDFCVSDFADGMYLQPDANTDFVDLQFESAQKF